MANFALIIDYINANELAGLVRHTTRAEFDDLDSALWAQNRVDSFSESMSYILPLNKTSMIELVKYEEKHGK